jgi:hypothetical protein
MQAGPDFVIPVRDNDLPGAVMRVEHLSIDGSVVSIEADADLGTNATTTGWAIVPALAQAHPFTISPAGHSSIVERTVRSAFGELSVQPTEEFSLKGGQLRVAEVDMPTATGGTRRLTVGAWEGKRGCMTTSLVGSQRDRLVEVFDTVDFSERDGGLAIDSPVTSRPREPEVVKEVPGVGVLRILPAIASVLETIPRARGRITSGGELFRVRALGNAVTLMTNSAVVTIKPTPDVDTGQMLGIAENLRVEWSPRRGR